MLIGIAINCCGEVYDEQSNQLQSKVKSVEMPTHLDPSLLGTKAHWDEVYARELENHSKDDNDEGTVWFEENGAEETILSLLNALVEQRLLYRDGPQASRVLDLGCGNGHMLFTLRQGDEDEAAHTSWTGSMIGVDYSAASVQLAKQIAERRRVQSDVCFAEWNILTDEPGTWFEDGFDLILDKGTFDAISLMAESEDGSHPCAAYCERVVALLRPGDLLVLTSCNWTKSELLAWLEQPQRDGKLQFVAEAKYPSFTFGGRSGQSIVTVALQRSEA